MSDKKKYKRLINLLPLIILCAVVPLIVFVKAVPLSGIVAQIWGKDLDADAFSWYKALVIVICGAAMLVILFLEGSHRRKDHSLRQQGAGLANKGTQYENQSSHISDKAEPGMVQNADSSDTLLCKRQLSHTRQFSHSPKLSHTRQFSHSPQLSYTPQMYPTRLKLWYFVPLLVYLTFTLLSTVFSDYRMLALTGFPERYEGMLVIAVYIITVFYIMNTVCDELSIKAIILPLMISAVLLSIPGIFQYFKIDYFQSDAIRGLLLGPAAKKAPKVLYDWNAVYSTLYNPNYVGSYMAMLLPLSVTFYILSNNKAHKILLGVQCSILFACQIGSRSRAGFLGIAFTAVVLLILLRKQLIKNWLYITGLMVSFGIIFTGMNSSFGGALKDQYERIGTEFQAVVTTAEITTPVRDIIVDKNRIHVDTSLNPIDIVYENNILKFMNPQGKILETQHEASEEGISIIFTGEKYNDYEFTYDVVQKTLNMTKANKEFMFAISDNELKFLDNKGRPAEIKPVEKLELGGREYVVKGRIYIWTRTIPILLDSLIFGKGPDTYPVYFPQNDYIGKLNGIGDMWIVIDKPHNLYLQVGTSGGIISMLAFIFLFAVYFLHSLYLYFNVKRFDFSTSAGIAFFAAFCGYAVAAVFNDSVVSVAPVFWVLLGLGIAVNLRMKTHIVDTYD